MKLNCKSGDLAIVINGENAGRLVEVFAVSRQRAGWWVVLVMGSAGVGSYFNGVRGRSNIGHISDKRLRPIRDQPGEDETLMWAGMPNKQGVTA